MELIYRDIVWISFVGDGGGAYSHDLAVGEHNNITAVTIRRTLDIRETMGSSTARIVNLSISAEAFIAATSAMVAVGEIVSATKFVKSALGCSMPQAKEFASAIGEAFKLSPPATA